MFPQNDSQKTDRWARLRFAIIGPLLAAPPTSRGELRQTLKGLSKKNWIHPVTGLTVRFGFATLERWFYTARKAQDPVVVLRRRKRRDAGRSRRLPTCWVPVIKAQYQAHPSWTVQLHYDNLVVQFAEDEAYGLVPSYGTIRRYMKAQGYHRRRVPKTQTAAAEAAAHRLESHEVRSFEAEHTLALWHLDFHHGSHKVLTRSGQWITMMKIQAGRCNCITTI